MELIKAVSLLTKNKDRLLTYLQKVVANGDFHYRIFGTQIEDYLTGEIIKLFTENGFIKTLSDYHLTQDKNEFPDLTLFTTPPLVLEIKSGNRSSLSKGEWTETNNSENDMGTLNMWQEKLRKFGGENIYYIFIEYNFNDVDKSILDIKTEPFYKFLGLNSEGLLKYREKDGNLRPKNFDADSPVKTLRQFMDLFPKTVVYRSKRIIKKHLEYIPPSERNSFLESLKMK